MVKEVRLFRENPLFVERGVRVVDLPGTNAVSAAVEEKIEEFLRRADVVIGVTGPEGFTRDERTMLERFQKFNIGAANRVMFVMNRMDLLDPKNLISAEAFRAYYRKNFVEVVEGARLRADRIFFASALWVELECMNDRSVDEQSRRTSIEVALQEGRRFLDGMKGIEPDTKKMLQSLYDDGGVPTFRAELLRFLERDVRRERLREVALQLRAVRERLSQLLEPERSSLGDVAIEGASSREVRDHLEKLAQAARRRILRLARELPGLAQASLGDGKARLAKALADWAHDPEKLDLEDARRERPGADGPELARVAVERARAPRRPRSSSSSSSRRSRRRPPPRSIRLATSRASRRSSSSSTRSSPRSARGGASPRSSRTRTLESRKTSGSLRGPARARRRGASPTCRSR